MMTNRNQADTDPLNHGNVAQQRQLSKKGKETAQQIGIVFQQHRIPIGNIYTSNFYRAIETAKLIGNRDGQLSLDIIEGGLVVSPFENDRLASALRQMINTLPKAGKDTLR